jgi:hypothetical protein
MTLIRRVKNQEYLTATIQNIMVFGLTSDASAVSIVIFGNELEDWYIPNPPDVKPMVKQMP